MAADLHLGASGATWIFQGNPKLYEIDTALELRDVIWWRTPQHRASINVGDRVLLWRSGKAAGFVGWGVVLHAPARFDVTQDDDPQWLASEKQPGEYFTPLRVWGAPAIGKAQVASASVR